MKMKITKSLSVCLLVLLAGIHVVNAQTTWTYAGGGGSSTAENSRSICTDASGNIYITGSYQNTVDFDFSAGGTSALTSSSGALSDIFIASYTSAGVFRWAVSAGSASLADNTGNGAIYTDGTSVYVTGNFEGQGAVFGSTTLNSNGGGVSSDIFVAKLNASTGAWTWAVNYGGTSGDNAYGICLDGSGNVYVAGNYQLTWNGCTSPVSSGSSDLFVQKINPSNGACVWVASGGSAAGGDAGTGAGICYASVSDKIVVTTEYSAGSATYGTFTVTNAGGNDVAVLEINPSTGAFTNAIGFGTANNDDGSACVYDTNTGDVFVAGAFDAATITIPDGSSGILLFNAGGTDIWAGRYSMTAHNFTWAKKAGGSSGTFNDERAFGICSDGTGTIAVTGSYLSATSSFGSLSLTNASGFGQVFIAGYSSQDGTESWVNNSITTNTPTLQSAGKSITTISNSGTYWVTGDFAATSTFGAQAALVSVGFNDVFNAKFTAPVGCPGVTVSSGGQTNVSCNGGSNGAATVTATGSPSFTYNWTPGDPAGDGTASVTGLTAGVWTCAVTDDNSCITTINFTVTEPAILAVTPASQTNVTCSGGSDGAASVNTPTGGTEAYTYNWTPGNPTGDGTTSVTGLTAGTWTCTVTDANNCSTAQVFTLTEINQPTSTADAGSDKTACVSPGTVTLAGVAPTVGSGTWTQTAGPVTGSINNTGSPTTSISGLITAGTYTFRWTVSNPPCSSTFDEVDVVVNANPLATITGGGVTVCPGSPAVTLSGPADPNYTYAWGRSLFTTPFAPLGTSQTQDVIASGIYQLTVTNQFGCIATSTSVVNVADYVFNGSIGAGDAQQTGRINRFAVISTCASPKVCPGLFTPTGARYYDSYTITNPRNTDVCATIGINSGCGTNIFCAAYSGSFNPASLCTNYLADPGSSFTTSGFYEATIPANSTIVVVVHEVNVGAGCGSYSLTIDLPREAPGVTVNPGTVACNETSTLTASTANTYSWNPGGAASQSITTPALFASATYDVTLGYGNNGCAATASGTVNISGGGPTISCEGPLNVNTDAGNCSATISNSQLLAQLTSVTGTPTPVISFSPAAGVFALGTTTVTATATNSCDVATCTFNVVVTDAEMPNAICQNITAQLNANGNATITASQVNNGSTDACGIASLSVSPNTFTCENVGANTVTLTVTDNNGNSSTCTATVTVEDNVDPVAVCQNITVQLDANGGASITASQVNNGSSDACGIASLSVSPNTFTCANVGANTVTLTVTDNNGNSSTCTATVTVEDNVDPVAVCQNITVQLDANGDASIAASQVNNGSTDACGIASLSVSPNTFTCANVGANTVTLTVTDNNGNSSTCTATVTVEDNVDPVATCQNITVQLDPNGDASIAASQVNNGSTDACGIASLSVSPNTFTCANVGANTVTLTVTDNNGNSSTCTATVTVEDNVDPVATCQNITVQLDPNGDASIAASQVNNGSTDACGIASLSVSPNTFTCANVGANTVTLTVTDNNGNSSTCTATVTVEDNVDPVATCQNITVQLDANGDAIISGADVDDNSSDACGIASLSVSPNTFNCNDVGANTVTLTVTDNNGNTSTCTATVTVEDNVAPVVSCHDLTVELSPNGSVTILTQDLHTSSSDACGIVSRTISQNQFDCSDVGDNIVIMTVTDSNGNITTCSSTVTVEDNIAPVAICQSITVQLDESGNATITGADVDNGSNDICDIFSLSVSPNSFDCSDVGANTVTLTATDSNGNTSTCTAIVTVEDNVVPDAVCQNITVVLNANGQASIVADDVDAGSTDACGIASLSVLPNSFDCNDVGANTVTLTVTDNNGNSSTCTATVTVEDNIDPLAVCQNITVQLDANGNATITGADVDNGSSDACGINSLSVSPNTFTCENVGANTVTLTVTDNNGNTSTCTATVTVEDNTAPVALCQNITVELDANGDATITPSDIDNGSSDACDITLALDITDFDCSDVGDNTVILTVTDNNGNTTTCTTTVTVEDNIAPVAVCQNVTVQLDVDGNASITASQINNGSSDACGIASLALDITDFDCSNVGDNTVTLTVTDNNGNTSTCTATVTVEYNVILNAVCQDITIQLDENGTASITASDVNGGSNGPCPLVSQTVSQTDFDCSHLGVNTVTLTLTDINGITATCTATVTVEDNVDPIISVSADMVICAQGTTGTVVNYTAPVFSDNCTGATVNQVAGLPSGSLFPLGETTNTFEVTDASGNTTSASFTVTINTLPGADFTFTGSCSDSPLSFTNTSTIGSGTIDQFDWNFGDGGTSTDEDPLHTFTTAGTYTVNLTLTTDMGCIATVNYPVEINPSPTFTTQHSNVSCNSAGDGEIVVIVNNGSGPFYYSLNGGQEQEFNTFSELNPGSYSVSVRNTFNCTVEATVLITQPSALTLVLTDSVE
jgi:PKD repeat protein